MTIVERLRRDAQCQPNKIEQAACLSTEAADLIERLRRYAEHHKECPVRWQQSKKCTCGLTALIKEIEHG